MTAVKSTNSKSYECCIIGAGPAGLGVALELTKHGVRNILILDKNKLIGGLARTDVFDGVRFDIGPHRFFTKNKEVNAIWHDILGEDFRPVRRSTHIFYKNKFFCYPLKPIDTLIKLGPIESLNSILSFISSQIQNKNKAITFEDWIIQKFGRKLYTAFFKVYTEKVWGIPCSQISAEWASQRIKGLDALELIKNSLLKTKKAGIKTLVEEFDYPVLGAGQMYETICDKVMTKGAELMLNSNVVRFNRKDDAITSVDVIKADGYKLNVAAKYFFSSIPLTHFFNSLNPSAPPQINNSANMLKYRDHITVNLLINKQHIFPDQWIYVHSPDIQMARLANYNNFSEAMLNGKSKTAISAEYFVFKGEGLWNESDESLVGLAIDELGKLGLVKSVDVENSWVVRETEAYPIHYQGLSEHLNLLKSRIDQFVNLYSIGRAGLHKYNNQDHSLISGILAARNYLRLPGSPYCLWDTNVDAEYQESAQRVNK